MPKNEYICDCNIVHGDIVEDTISKMPGMYMMNCVADFFKIMGDSTRCKLLFALLQNENVCVRFGKCSFNDKVVHFASVKQNERGGYGKITAKRKNRLLFVGR